MTITDPKTILHRYLQEARDAVLWKLDGLSEYDVRRPLVPTGTNLLGLAKHLTCGEFGYFGETFDRPSGEHNLWFDDDVEDNIDMWATAEESRDDIVSGYLRACTHADGTIEALDLDARGRVPWWPGEHGEVTLHQILVHMVAETQRHAGHADVVRELIDGAAGIRPDNSNMPDRDAAWWQAYFERVDQAARQAAGR
jgi:hypothetical protein